MGIARKITEASKAGYHAVEERLNGLFTPVPPRDEFVQRLGQHIRSQPPATRQRLTDLHFILFIVAGFLSILALIAVGLRAILHLFGIHRRSPHQT